MKKSSLKINDLKSESSEFNFGLTSSFGVLTSRAHFFAEYSCTDEDDNQVDNGAQSHTAAFMESEENKTPDTIAYKKALRLLADNKVSIEGLNPEVIKLLAEQLTDLDDAPNATSYSAETSVRVNVQRKSANGNWFNVTDKQKNKIEFTLDIADVFELNEQDEPIAFKVVSGELAIVEFMRLNRHLPVHNYSYVDQESGELVFKAQEQRFMVQSQMLTAGMTINGTRLESTVAPFFSKYDLEAKEIYFGISYYGYDNVVDFGAVAIIPSSKDESNGDAANKDYDDGILTGTSQATQAMMSDDMADDHIAFEKNEEAKAVKEGKRARSASFNKKDTKLVLAEALLKSEMGAFVTAMVPRTYAAQKDAALQNAIYSELKACSDVTELLKVVEAYREVHGKGFAYASWKALDSMVTVAKNKAFADMVDEHILINITNLNKGLLLVDDLDDASLIEIRETSVKFGRKNKACWIVDANVSNAIKLKYARVTGKKVS